MGSSSAPLPWVRAPLVPLAGALIAGVAAGRYLPVSATLWAVLGAAGLLLAAVSLRRAHLRLLTSLAVATAVFATGAVRMREAYFSVPENHIVTFTGRGKTLSTLRGRVISPPEIVSSGVEFGYQPEPRMVFDIQAEAVRTGVGRPGEEPSWRNVTGSVRVSVDEPYRRFAVGDRLELLGWMGRFARPGNPGQYDSAAAGRRRGVWVWFRAPTEQCTRLLTPATDDRGWRSWLGRVRARLRQHWRENGDLQDGRLVSALVLGERSPGLATLNRVMREAGVSHFLSISGMHLGVFLGFVYVLCRVLRLSPRSSATAAMLVLGAYLLLAETRPPLLRSAIMASCLLVGVIVHRPGSVLNALALAAMLLLLIDPCQLLQAGFQLSFLTVAGLILLYRPAQRLLFGRWLRRRGLMVFRSDQRVRRWFFVSATNGLIDAVTLCVTAYAVSAPLVAMRFGLFSPWAIVLNVLLFPLVVAVLVPGYISTALVLPMPNLSAAVGDVAGAAAGVLADVAGWLRYLPGLSMTLRPLGLGWLVLCYATLLAVLFARGRRSRRILAGALVVALVGATLWTQRPARCSDGARFDLLAVGAGQCAILQTPAGQTYLIDAGTHSGYDACERVLAPFLRKMCLPSPEAAFVSHDNTDHYNALPGVIRRGRLRRVYLNEVFGREAEPYSAAARFGEMLRGHRVEVRRLRRGDRLTLDSRTRVEVLWPPAGREDLSVNDTSLVLRITCDDQRLLVPGDLDETGQAELLQNPDQLSADVLVLPHHGGWEKTFPAFVAAVRPRIVLVSSRADPHGPDTAPASVRAFYKQLHTDYRYYATPRNGWIRLRLGRGNIDVQTMR